MSNLFNAMHSNTYSTTANGAKTLPDSGNSLVDLFSAIGSSRGKDLTGVFSRAFGGDTTSNVLATRILLWARDVRGGAGERQTFRSLLKLLENGDKTLTKAVINKIPEVGRWDDMFYFSEPYAVDYAYSVINDALFSGNALCAKWMPRKGKVAAKLRNYLGLSPRDYRRLVVDLTKVVETQMCAKDWNSINYEHVPSVASARLGKAFMRNDEVRYRAYLDALENGEAKVNASAIFPYDVIRGTNQKLADAQWKALPDYLEGSDENLLSVIDVSASMNCSAGGTALTCMDVAISLGLYVCERSKGIFKDQFITFSQNPSLEHVTGPLSQRVNTIHRSNWGYNTNIQATFDLVLNSAVNNNLPECDMPTKIIIFSDMEFDICARNNLTNFQEIERKYENAGYKRPDIVFWNLNAREGNSPVRFDENGTALVSGFSPSLMKSILSGKNVSPFSMMMETIMDSRYDLV